MFCNNCGFKLEDDAKFCTNCGAKVESKVVKPEEPIAEPAAETVKEPVAEPVMVETKAEPVVESAPKVVSEPIAEQPAVVQNPVETVENEQPAPKKKKSKKGLFIGLGIAAVIVAVLAALAALNFSTVKNFVKKTVSSDEEYFKYVHEEQAEDLAANLSEAISSLAQMPSDPQDVISSLSNLGAKMTVKVNKPAVSFLEQNIAQTGMKLDWLNGADLVVDVVYGENNKLGMDMGVKLNDKDIATMNFICDVENQKVYFCIPELNNEYVCLDLNSVNTGTRPAERPNNSMISGSDISYMSATSDRLTQQAVASPSNALAAMDFSVYTKHLPEQKKLEELLNKYISLILESIEEVDKENDTVEVGGLTCKCTKYTIEVDDELVQNIFKAVLTELKNDEVIKEYIIKTADELGEDGDDIYDDFKDSIKEGLDNLDELKVDDFDYNIWVDSNGNIVAFELDIDSFKIEYRSLEKGEKFATEFSMGDKETKLGFENEGTKKDGKIDSETRFTMNGTSYVIVEANGLDPESDALVGSLTVSLGQGLRDMMKMAGNDLLTKFADAKLVIEGNDSTAKFSLNLKSEEWFSIEVVASETESKSVEIPSKYINGNSEKESQEWAKKMSFDKIISNLESANVPSELVSELRKAANQLG